MHERYTVSSIGGPKHPNQRAIEDLDNGIIVAYLDDYGNGGDDSTTDHDALDVLIELANVGAGGLYDID